MNGSKSVRLEEMNTAVAPSYSWTQAIADGELVDVSEAASEAGFLCPVALTRAVWDEYVEVPAGVMGQDIESRMWDILCMTFFAIMTSPPCRNPLPVPLSVRNDNWDPTRVTLKAIRGPGDLGTRVLAIGLPDERLTAFVSK